MMNEQRRRRSTEEENPSLSSVLLPDELIEAILVRLPVSSLLRFKSVCKSWLSVISDPQFAKSQFDLAASPTHRLLLSVTDDLKFQSLDIESSPSNDDESEVLNYPREQQPYSHGYALFSSSSTSLQVMGSCRGFLLLLSRSPNQPEVHFIVCNPSTGFHRKIPSSYSFSDYTHFQYGFGYDQSTDDYLLVSINSFPGDPSPSIKLFSLKTNLTCSLPLDNEYHYLDCGRASDLFLHGSLHWLVTSRITRLHVLLAFDLVGKSLSKIAQSPDLAQEQLNNKPYDLREMAGCLALCYSAYGEMAEMWIMKEYKVQSSWTKIVFSTHDESPCFFPICFTKCGDVFGSDEFGRLLRLNDKGKLLPVYPWDWSWESRYRLLYSRMYTASILSLPS